MDGDADKFNELLTFGPYTIERLAQGEFIEPIPGVVESMSQFKVDFADTYAIADTSQLPTTISKYDETTSEYVVLENNITITSEAIQTAVSEYYRYTLTLANGITEPGKYKVTIPKYAFRFDAWGEIYYNDLIEAEYEIVAPIDPAVAFTPVSINPAEGEVESLSEITITYDGQYFPQGLWDMGAAVEVFNESEEVVMEGYVSIPGANPQIIIKLDEEITEPGNYEVVVEGGMIQDYVDSSLAAPEIRLNYTVVAPKVITMTVSPAGGNSGYESATGLDVIDDSTFTIIFEGATEEDVIEINPEFLVASNDTYKMIVLYEVDTEFNGGPKSVAMYPVLKEGTNNEFHLVKFEGSGIEWPILSSTEGFGYFWLSIPNGAFTINGEESNYYSLYYTLNAETGEVTITVTPQGGEDFPEATKLPVIDDTTFTVTIEGDAQTIEINEAMLDWNSWDLISLWDIDENWYMGDKSVSLYPVLKEGTTNEFSLVKFAESGSEWPITSVGAGYFVLVIPEGTFIIDGVASAEIALAYTMDDSGIEAVDMNAQDLNVYSINGMLIKRNASWNEVLDFEPGIYIVNGQKVYIRK